MTQNVLPSDLEKDTSSLSKLRSFSESMTKGRDELLATFSKLEMVTSLLTQNQTRSNLEQQKKSASSAAEQAAIQSKLESIERIAEFQNSSVIEVMKKVRENEEVSAEESAALVDAVSRLANDIKLVESSNIIDRSSLHSAQISQMKSGDTNALRRGDIVSRFILDTLSTDSMVGSKSTNNMMKGLGIQGMDKDSLKEFLNTKSGKRFISRVVDREGESVEMNMQSVVNELNEIKDINKRANTAAELVDLEASNEELTTSIQDLANRMFEMPQFLDTNLQLKSLMEKSEKDGSIDRRQLKELLTKIDSDTVPAKTLYSLDKMNDQMDDMLLSQESIQSSVSKGVLGQFKEKASNFTGKATVKDSMLALASASLGVNPMLLEGMTDMLPTDMIGDMITGRNRRGGRGAGRGAGRGRGLISGGKDMIGGSLGKMSKLLNLKTLAKVGKLGLKFAKFLPIVGVVVQAVTSIFDAFSGWNNAAEITGKAEGLLTTTDKVKAASASLLSGLTLGIVDVQTMFGLIDGAWTTIMDSYETAKDKFSELGDKVSEVFSGVIDSIWDSIKSVIPDSLLSIGGDVADTVSDVTDKTKETVTGWWSSATSWWEDDKPEKVKTATGKVAKSRESSLMQMAMQRGLSGNDLANFMGQMSHESSGFADADLKENYNGNPQEYFKKYDNRKDLGNVEIGDGFKYRGRGFIQLTGRSNYEEYGKILGIDLINNPDLAALPDIANQIALAYWEKKNLSGTSVKEATRAINGGYNGLEDREERVEQYQSMLAKRTNELNKSNASGIEKLDATGKVIARSGSAPSSTRTPAPVKPVIIPSKQTTVIGSQSSSPSMELAMIGSASIFN